LREFVIEFRIKRLTALPILPRRPFTGPVEELDRLGERPSLHHVVPFVPPHLPLVNGALARVVVDGETREITQSIA